MTGRLRRSTVATLDFARHLARHWKMDRASGLSAEVAFFALLGLFPALLMLASVLGVLDALVGRELAVRVEDEILSFLRRVLTDEADQTLEAVTALFSRTDPGTFTVGLLGALWASTRSSAAVIAALDVAYDVEERRGPLHRRALGLALALGTVAVGALTLAMFVVGPLLGSGQDLAGGIGLGRGFEIFWNWFRWPVGFAVMAAWMATVYHAAPNHRTRWRDDVAGALATSVLWVAVSLGFRAYVLLSGGGNLVVGSLGGALVTVVWLYAMSAALILGGEVNAVRAERARGAVARGGTEEAPQGAGRRGA